MMPSRTEISSLSLPCFRVFFASSLCDLMLAMQPLCFCLPPVFQAERWEGARAKSARLPARSAALYRILCGTVRTVPRDHPELQGKLKNLGVFF